MEIGIVAITSIRVGLSLTASNEDGSCAFGLSLTFRIDIIIFASLPAAPKRSALPASAQKSLFEVDTGAYLREKTLQLKDFYNGWETYLKDYQSKITGTVFKSMDEVESKMKEIVLEQVAVRDRIEQMIKEVDSKLKTAKLDIKNTNAVLKFLSNCYQIIRDLSLTFVLGQHTLEMNMEPSEDADVIRGALLKKYARYGIIEKIKRRRSISEAILAGKNELSGLNNSYADDEGKLLAIKERAAAEQKKVECRKNSLPFVEKAVGEWNALEMKSLTTRLAILDREIVGYESKIAELSAQKKKAPQQAEDGMQKFLKEIRQEREALAARLDNAQYSTTKEQIAYIGEAGEMKDSELSQIKRKMSTTKGKITKLETKIGELLAEYEEIVKEIV